MFIFSAAAVWLPGTVPHAHAFSMCTQSENLAHCMKIKHKYLVFSSKKCWKIFFLFFSNECCLGEIYDMPIKMQTFSTVLTFFPLQSFEASCQVLCCQSLSIILLFISYESCKLRSHAAAHGSLLVQPYQQVLQETRLFSGHNHSHVDIETSAPFQTSHCQTSQNFIRKQIVARIGEYH